MSAVLIIVRLRWTLTMAALRKSPWQKVAFIVGIVLAAAIAAGVGAASWFVGLFPVCGPASGGPVSGGPVAGDCGPADIMAFPMIRVAILPMACMVGLMWAFVPLTYTGDGSSLSPRRFALFGLRDRDLALGVLLSGLAGVPSITLFVALSLTALIYRSAGALPMIGAVVGALLATMTFVAVSKALIALATSLVRSRRGQGSLYLILVLLIVVFAEAPSILTGTGAMGALFAGGPGRAIAMVDILSWTPFGAPVQLPYDLMGFGAGVVGVDAADVGARGAAGAETAGISADPAWGLAAARVIVALATVMLCMLVIMWCVRHDRLTTGRNAAAVRAKGLGAFGWMPVTPSGAVSARVATYWRRDPRYLVGLLMPVVVFVLLLVRGWARPELMWGAPLIIAWVVPIIDSNSLAYDGRAFTMQASIGVRGIDDRIGRVRVSAGLGLALVALSVIACMAMNAGATSAAASADGGAPGEAAGGDASGRPVGGMDALGVLSRMAQSAGAAGAGASLSAASPVLAVAFGGGAVAVLLCGIGLAQVLSCVLMYPVATADKPFSSPQGRAAAQGFFPLAQLFGVYACCIPTIATTVALLLTDRFGLLWVAGVVGVVNGVAGLAAGVWLGGRLLDARTPAIVRALDNFASLAK